MHWVSIWWLNPVLILIVLGNIGTLLFGLELTRQKEFSRLYSYAERSMNSFNGLQFTVYNKNSKKKSGLGSRRRVGDGTKPSLGCEPALIVN